MQFGSFADFRSAVRLKPAPDRNAEAPSPAQLAQRLGVDTGEDAHSRLWQGGQVPFHRAAARALEVEPAESGRRREHVAEVRLAVQRALVPAPPGQGSGELTVGLEQKRSIVLRELG